MFENIGGKIKTLAKLCCLIGIIGSVIYAIVLFTSTDRYQDFTAVGIIVLICGPLASWIGSFCAYGFGELIERIQSIDNKLGEKTYKGNKAKKQIQSTKDESNYSEEDVPQPNLTCELCGMKCDELTSILIDTRKGRKTKKVCHECLEAQNRKQTLADSDTNIGQKPVKVEITNNEPKEQIKESIFIETDEEKIAREKSITQKREKGGVLQEDLFLEDIEPLNTVKKIIKVWNIYEFDDVYPAIGNTLNDYLLKEKQSIGGLSQSTIKGIKTELSRLFLKA